MNARAKLAMGVLVALIASLSTPPSYAQPSHAPRSAGGAATAKPETYVIVRIGDDDPKVITKSEYKTLPKTTREEYNKAKKEYEEAKKAADKNKEKLDMPKPVLPKIHRLGPPSFKTEDDAKDWLDKHPQAQDAGKKAPAQ